MPEEGIEVRKFFPDRDPKAMAETMHKKGAEFGLEFNEVKILANSRKAIEASEFARDQGKCEGFSEGIFKAYFTEGLNIGDMAVIDEVARKCNLNIDEMHQAIKEGRYLPRMEEIKREAEMNNIEVLPTFIINEKHKIFGAQSIQAFRNALIRIEKEEKNQG